MLLTRRRQGARFLQRCPRSGARRELEISLVRFRDVAAGQERVAGTKRASWGHAEATPVHVAAHRPMTEGWQHRHYALASHPAWNWSLATPNRPSDGGLIRGDASTIASPQVAPVDVTCAPNATRRPHFGVSDRSAHSRSREVTTWAGKLQPIGGPDLLTQDCRRR